MSTAAERLTLPPYVVPDDPRDAETDPDPSREMDG